METKLFSLQSPERIAKLYGGNKQKIFQALQSGALRRFAPAPMDQILAAAAADFINQMRDAAQAEAAPQQTVFEQLFAPPAPQAPAGLGAMPQAAAMPPMNPPQPSAGLGAMPEAAAMPAPEAAPPMGMAMGGMVPPYAAGGGLSDLPLPDGMFDEPSNGGFGDGYRGGGLVAFAGGEEVEDEDEDFRSQKRDAQGNILVDAPEKPTVPAAPDFEVPTSLYGLRGDILSNLDRYAEAAPRETKYAKEYAQYLEGLRNPEEQRKQRKQDMWMALGQLGAKMASTPGSLLQAASAGIGEALPGIAAAAKERRADQRAIMQALVAEERTSNKEITERADKALDMVVKYGTLAEAMKDRAFRNLWENMASSDRRYVAQVAAAAGITQQQISASASRDVAETGKEGDALRYNFQVNQMVNEMIAPGGSRYVEYMKAPDKNAFVNKLRTSLGASDNVMKFDSKGNPVK